MSATIGPATTPGSRPIRRGRCAAVWKAERFSWWMTSLLHAFPQADGFDRRIQRAEFDALASSDHAAALLARDYTGLSRL